MKLTGADRIVSASAAGHTYIFFNVHVSCQRRTDMKDMRSGRNGRAFRTRGMLAPVAAMSAGCASSGGGGGSTTSKTSSVINVAYLGDQSGTLATTFGQQIIGVKAFVSYYNAHGGLDGHQLKLSVYDTQSNASSVLSDARLAVENGADAMVSQDVYFGSAT